MKNITVQDIVVWVTLAAGAFGLYTVVMKWFNDRKEVKLAKIASDERDAKHKREVERDLEKHAREIEKELELARINKEIQLARESSVGATAIQQLREEHNITKNQVEINTGIIKEMDEKLLKWLYRMGKFMGGKEFEDVL